MLLGKLPFLAQKAFASYAVFNAILEQKVTKKAEKVNPCLVSSLKSLMITDFD